MHELIKNVVTYVPYYRAYRQLPCIGTGAFMRHGAYRRPCFRYLSIACIDVGNSEIIKIIHKSRIIVSTFEHIKNGALTVTLQGSSSPFLLLFSRFPVTVACIVTPERYCLPVKMICANLQMIIRPIFAEKVSKLLLIKLKKISPQS